MKIANGFNIQIIWSHRFMAGHIYCFVQKNILREWSEFSRDKMVYKTHGKWYRNIVPHMKW